MRLITEGGRSDLAILDVNLPDGDIGPVAAALTIAGTPFLFHTGLGLPDELMRLYSLAPLHRKPTHTNALVSSLAGLRGGRTN